MGIDLTDEKVRGEVLEALKKDNLVIRTKDEDESFVNSKLDLKAKEIESRYTPLFSKVKELTGYDGDADGEKLIEEAINNVKKTSSKSVSEWQKKYSELEKTVAEKEPAFNTIKQQFDQFKEFATNEKQTLLKQLEDARLESQQSTIKNEVGLATIKHLPKIGDNKHTVELANARVDAFLRTSKFETVDGKRVVKDANGKIYQSAQDGSILSVDEIVDGLLSELYDQKRVQVGAGSGKSGEEGGVEGLPEGINNQMDLLAYYQKQGKLNDDEIAKKVTELAKKYKLPIR